MSTTTEITTRLFGNPDADPKLVEDATAEYKQIIERMTLDEKTAEHARLSMELKAIEILRDTLKPEMVNGVLLDPRTDTDDEGFKYRNDLGTFAVQTKTTKTINGQKLVARGVDPDLVRDCTDENESAPFVTFYPKKKKKS